ncbi:MAG: DNA primase DnaG [Candidatus Woesearchaeota archaeon]|jgi:DNA primase|nr:DNA primase DnaG [Candidatus Woesearchaeota archaeon]MDP7458177.1 DNA primase DnaG [Candidatus Woesearchaeota archaeon]
MGKISPVSAKYITHASIEIDGVVDKPDVIGAVFGQTEGLLGADLELRELQRSGRIGRIEVNVDTRSGKTSGMIIVPSSLDKAETAIVGASLEIIQRIGPCNAKIRVQKIEDVRVSKRKMVVERAKELLKGLMDKSMPDSQELADEVAYSVRVMEISEYGKDRLPAGPAIDESDEIIVVEGRADVLNLLKHGFKNVISINGTNVPQTIIDLSKEKVIIAFVDGDRGGNLIIKELTQLADIDFVTRAPDGKEVEEITKKEIHKALRSKFSAEQAKLEAGKDNGGAARPDFRTRSAPQRSYQAPARRAPVRTSHAASPKIGEAEKKRYREMLEDLIGTRGAYLVDEKLNILGKIPFTELAGTLKNVQNVQAVVFDGIIDKETVLTVEKSGAKLIFGMDSRVKPTETKLGLFTVNDL